MLNFQKYFPDKVILYKNLKHGGNNHLWKVITESGEYILKQYEPNCKPKWDRLGSEYRALTYLWSKGFREIPQPISIFKEENIAIYTYEQGVVLKPQEVNEKHIVQALNFIVKTHSLKTEDKKSFGLAREPCLCVQDYSRCIERRFSYLMDALSQNESAIGREAKILLMDKFAPRIAHLNRMKIFKDKESREALSLEEQVLATGDFGFHNILFSQEKMVFTDFEYFGRNDPAKDILVFLHSDSARSISPNLKDKFLKEYLDKIPRSEAILNRLKIVDPFVGLIWALIYLNIFLKADSYQKESAIQERIMKAKQKINNLNYF